MKYVSRIAATGLLCWICAGALAQSPGAQPSAPQSAPQPEPAPDPQASGDPAFTLHTGIRLVLTDVTVTDANGNIVHNLPQSAFHITDDGHPQQLKSFQEHTASEQTPIRIQVSADGSYSNAYMLHLPPVLNILVLDTTNLSIVDQMGFNVELTRFLKNLPADQPLAVYARIAEKAVLIQHFTSDSSLLLSAAAKVLPRLPVLGVDRARISDAELLRQIAMQLNQIPGRKNVIWFSGGSSAFLHPDPMITGEDPGQLRQVYDELEAARIAIYPIDARGLQVYAARSATGQHMQMEDIAEATGGEARFNTNGLAAAANRVLATDTSFYTLTYNPSSFELNNKWHKVHVTVDGKFTLSYRRGYFADGNNLQNPHPYKPRQRLLADGKTSDVPADVHSAPVIFQVRVQASQSDSTGPSGFVLLHPLRPPGKGEQAYFIQYTVPADTFAANPEDGREMVNFDVAAAAFNPTGERLALDAQRVHVRFPSDNPHLPIQISQQIDLRKGDVFLFLAIWDVTTGRLGTLQIPLTLPLPAAKASLK